MSCERAEVLKQNTNKDAITIDLKIILKNLGYYFCTQVMNEKWPPLNIAYYI